MRLIDADHLSGYKFGLISPYAQKLFHQIINEAPTVDIEEYVERGAITENMIMLDKIDSIKAEIRNKFIDSETVHYYGDAEEMIASDCLEIIDKHIGGGERL